jgi:DNA mismatch repair protein MutS
MVTPLRSQYLNLKRQYPDVILFFRLGDFYETFDEDAQLVASVCDIVLTSRPVGGDERVPLAGVPYHAVEGYVAKLVSAGYKVAIAEQIGSEPPQGEKVVPRYVRRVVTPGTVVEPALLVDKANNYLAAVVFGDDLAQSATTPAVGIAYADITTGEFAATELRDGPDVSRRAIEELARLSPAEVLYPVKESRAVKRMARLPEYDQGPGRSDQDYSRISALQGFSVTPYAAWHFSEETARQVLLDHLGTATLDGFGLVERPYAMRAAGGLIQYLRETQQDSLGQLAGLRCYDTSGFMTLDTATRRNLELIESMRSGTTKGALVGVLDVTLTPMGGRLLRRRLNQPLLDIQLLEHRLAAVNAWHDHASDRNELRQLLRGLGDLERWTNRAIQAICSPRELHGIRGALARVEQVSKVIARLQDQDRPGTQTPSAEYDASDLDPCSDVAALIREAISEDTPVNLGTPGVIRPGFSPELDGIHLATRDARAWIANLEGAERERTGIKSLKVGYNRVFGYYIEVTKANANLVPADYIRRQTLVNAERYITPQLKEYESLVLNAEERILELEGQLYRQVMAQVASASQRLLATATALADLDVSAALAEVGEANRYVRPTLTNDDVIDIKGGRHPVVEQMLSGEAFTPNDTHLSDDQAIVVLTGPNMSGKSTYLRQVALIVLMAQIGSYVPAASAHLGVVDRIFTRIGASDEIARGQSTFMVEMVETANILHHATSRSLLILDEIGRGTSTYDGLAIAWAVIEYIHNHPRLRAKTLFATHYHELTDLAERLPHVTNFNVAVAEQGDTVVFLHMIVPGSADRSYGVHVAQMAGLPKPVVDRAQEILGELEASGAAGPRRSIAAPTLYQLSLFSRENPIVADICALDINALSPLDALNKLYELQQRARKGELD